jgi:hypothetical protein
MQVKRQAAELGTRLAQVPSILQHYNKSWEGRMLPSHDSVYFLRLTNYMSWVPLAKPPVAQLFKNFPTFYGNRRFIIVFTRALYWSLSSARSIQLIPTNLISLWFILLLSSHQRLSLPSGLFPSGLPTKSSPHACHLSYPSHPPLLDYYKYTWQKIQVMTLFLRLTKIY